MLHYSNIIAFNKNDEAIIIIVHLKSVTVYTSLTTPQHVLLSLTQVSFQGYNDFSLVHTVNSER